VRDIRFGLDAMSDQQQTDQPSQAKKKHAGGRPKKPKPAPPLPPPTPYSLEETLLMGDQAAAKGTPAAQLRWVSQRALFVKESQARKDADRHDALEVDNQRLRESVLALEGTRRKLENELEKKDRDVIAAKTESAATTTNLNEMADEHAKQLGELTNKLRASESNAQGLLAFLRCVCLQMKDLGEGKRIEFAARLMHFSEQARKEAQRLAELLRNPETHREYYASWYWNLPQDPAGHGVTPEQFARIMESRQQKVERSMQEDWNRLAFQASSVISEEVMDQAFKLLGVSREEVVRQLDTEQQERNK
jgi:hypothetical protein